MTSQMNHKITVKIFYMRLFLEFSPHCDFFKAKKGKKNRFEKKNADVKLKIKNRNPPLIILQTIYYFNPQCLFF